MLNPPPWARRPREVAPPQGGSGGHHARQRKVSGIQAVVAPIECDRWAGEGVARPVWQVPPGDPRRVFIAHVGVGKARFVWDKRDRRRVAGVLGPVTGVHVFAEQDCRYRAVIAGDVGQVGSGRRREKWGPIRSARAEASRVAVAVPKGGQGLVEENAILLVVGWGERGRRLNRAVGIWLIGIARVEGITQRRPGRGGEVGGIERGRWLERVSRADERFEILNEPVARGRAGEDRARTRLRCRGCSGQSGRDRRDRCRGKFAAPSPG